MLQRQENDGINRKSASLNPIILVVQRQDANM
jgi:hypothetical protein